MSQDIYYYRNGVRELVKTLNGNEKIHTGIRPYGFHAGNAAALCVYPKIVCDDFVSFTGKNPAFTFIISINDWEQDELDGPDYRKYPYNIYPKKTTIQHLRKNNASMVDFWHEVIESNVRFFLKDYKQLTFKFYRNSELLQNSDFRDFLIQTLKDPITQKDIYQKLSFKEVLEEPVSFAGLVCNNCFSVSTNSFYFKKNDSCVGFNCNSCKTKHFGLVSDFNYWWYHKPLLIGRLSAYEDIDILLSGGDHLDENDHLIRDEMIRRFIPHKKVPKMLFAPIIVSYDDGEKMSKSRNNIKYADNYKLFNLLNHDVSSKIFFDKAIQINLTDYEYKEVSIKNFLSLEYLK